MRDPAAIKSLVLEEPPLVPLIAGNPPPVPLRILRSFVMWPRATLSVMRFAATRLAPVEKMIRAGEFEASVEPFARSVLGNAAYERLPASARDHMRANVSTHVGQVLSKGGFDDIDDAEIRAVKARALIVTGTNSPPMFRHLAALLTSLLPNARSLDVPAASHVMHLENPDALNAGLLQFLTG
jgi:pimeloyl-ACP methyl ester carboxylesterase